MLSCHFLAAGGALGFSFLEYFQQEAWVLVPLTVEGEFLFTSFFRFDSSFDQILPTHTGTQCYRADGEVWEPERQEARFGVWPCKVFFSHRKFWISSCCLWQTHATAARSHLQGEEKIALFKVFFFTFSATAMTNPAVTAARIIHRSKSDLLHPSFQNSLRTTHLCPRADILITIPPMSTAGEGGTCRIKRLQLWALVECPELTGGIWEWLQVSWTHHTCSNEEVKSPALKIRLFSKLRVQVWGKKTVVKVSKQMLLLRTCCWGWCNLLPGWGQPRSWGGPNPLLHSTD